MTTYTTEERLAILLSLARHDDAERAELDALVERVDWPTLDALLAHNAIRPLARRHLMAYGHWARVPVGLAGPWEADALAVAERNRLRLEAATPLFTEAAEAGIAIAVLKGVYFAEAYYGDPLYKKMNDIDLLMKVEDLERLYALYARHGFFSAAHLLDDDKQIKFSHHAPPFFHRSLHCALGTHWGLVSPLTKYRLDYDAIWRRAVPFEFLGRRHHALSAIDNAHHLCVHMPYYKTGLRELADLYNLLRAEPDFDWATFEAEVDRSRTAELVVHALSLANALVPMPAVEAALARLRPKTAGFYAEDTARRIREPRRILHARSTHMSSIDKAYTDFEMTDHFPTKLAAWARLWGAGLFAPRAEIARFHYLDARAWYLPLLAPSMFARVLRYIAKDLGWKIFALVVFKQKVDLARSLGRTLTGRCKPDELSALAERHGLGLDQLKTLKGLLE